MLHAMLRSVLLAVLLAVITAAVASIVGHQERTGPPRPGGYELVPAPWLVPKEAGGTALRLAMVHDVLHERFYLHGPAWFEHRHQRVAHELALYEDGSKPKDERYSALLDDYAVDFDRLGRPAEGIPILRRKLDLQQPIGADGKRAPPDPRFYTTYANLGTLLAHEHLKGALKKEPAALAGLREGLALIEQSVAVNPEAHFGRERWQVVTLRYLLHASDDPTWLTTSDLMGVPWNGHDPIQRHGGYPVAVLARLGEDEALRKRVLDGPRGTDEQELARSLRRSIPVVVSSDQAWLQHCGQDLVLPVPFDEPALAIVGIWTLGSGANPHFALALAHLMEGMGQRAIAWNAYERASGLAGRFWADAALQRRLVDHCRERQAALEPHLGEPVAALRERHQLELAYGRAEQAAYQAYEAERIAAGRDPAGPGFYDDFFRGRAPIASAPGDADTVVRKLPSGGWRVALWVQAIFCGILALLLLSDVLRRRKELSA